MDVHSLAQTPVFLFSLVITGLVASYTFAALLRAMLAQFSFAAATSGVQPLELLAADLVGKHREQLQGLQSRVDAVAKFSRVLPAPFADQSWTKLLDTCNALQGLHQELLTLVKVRNYEEGVKLGRFLTGSSAAAPSLMKPLDDGTLLLVAQWPSKTTALLQRMVAKLEDSARDGKGADGRPLQPNFFAALDEIRNVIIIDETRFR